MFAQQMAQSKEFLDLTYTSTYTGEITAPTVNLPSINFYDAARLDQLAIKCGPDFEER